MFKIAVVGARETGKSSFIERLVGEDHVYLYGSVTTKVCTGRDRLTTEPMGTFYLRFKEFQYTENIEFDSTDALMILVDASSNDTQEFNTCLRMAEGWIARTSKPACIVMTKSDLIGSCRRRRHIGQVHIFYVSTKYDFSAAPLVHVCKLARKQILLQPPIYENETDENYIII